MSAPPRCRTLTNLILDCPAARLVLVNAQGHSREQIESAKPSDPIYGWVSDEELARGLDGIEQAVAAVTRAHGAPASLAAAE